MKKNLAFAMSVMTSFFLAQLCPVLAVAQGAAGPPRVLHNPDVNTPIHFDISPPLSEMANEVAPLAPQAAPLLRRPKPPQNQGAVEDGALQTSVLPLVSASVGLNLLGVGNGFPNYNVPDAPPDVNLAVGDTQVLQWVNVSYAIFDKTTGAILQGPTAGNAFWSGFGGACQTSNSGDPIAQWDKIAHRWVVTQNVFSSPYMTCIAVSTTPDATGTYFRFAFQQPGFPDYPKFGIWPDAYYQSQNNFGPLGAVFVGAYVCAYERAKLLVGDSTAKQVCFQNGTFDDSLLPADLDSAGTLPPSGQAEVYLGSIDNGSTTSVYQYLFHVDFASPANSTFTGGGGTMPITVASFTLPCSGGGNCVPQPSPGEQLASLGDRLMYRLAYRNFSGSHQTWLVSHSVSTGGSVGERWYEFHAPETSTTLSVFQQGTFAPDSNYRWMGSIAMDQNQDIALGYSISSSSMFPSVNYTGRVSTDPLGTMETESSIIAGTGAQINTSNRWGDYSSMAIDEADDCTFWYTAEYYQATASFDWSTRLASLKFNGCGGPPVPDFSLTAIPSTQTVVQGGSTSYTVTATPLNGYTGTVKLSVSGCPSNTTCTLNPGSLTLPPAGNSTLSVQTTTSTPAGTYTLTIKGTDGTLTHTTTVTLVVNAPDFSITASPSSRSVRRGSSTTYTATVTALNGFSGTVSLTVSGCPSLSTCTLNPTSVTLPPSPKTSTLTVASGKKTPTGTSTLTIKGTSGSLMHSTTVSLTVTAH